MWTEGTYVRLRTDDEWDQLFGIVDNIYNEVIKVFCIAIPYRMYYVTTDIADGVLEAVTA